MRVFILPTDWDFPRTERYPNSWIPLRAASMLTTTTPARGGRNRCVLVQAPYDEGLPDGHVVDARGFIWSAVWHGSCSVRYDREGRVEHRVRMLAKQTSSLAFGGPELSDTLIPSEGQSEIIPTMPPGYDPYNGIFGGPSYHINPGIARLCPNLATSH